MLRLEEVLGLTPIRGPHCLPIDTGHASIAIAMDTCGHPILGLQEDPAARIDTALRTYLELRS